MSQLPNKRLERTNSSAKGYILPSDVGEPMKIDEHHEGLKRIMFKMVIHSPVPSRRGTRLLDIGCRTGSVTVELGTAYPFAKILGVDLRPVPLFFKKPKNVQYIQGSFFSLANCNDGNFKPCSFDFAFSRLLTFAVKDWQAYVAQIASLLKPGGYAEMHEFDRRYLQDGKPADEGWHWKQAFDTVSQRKGYDMHSGVNMAKYMREAGLVDVQQRVYQSPIGTWMVSDRYETAYYGEILGRQELEFSQRSLGKMLEGSEYSSADIADMQAECKRTVEQTPRLSFDFIVTTGRKP